jgi:hypothetical protein
VGEGTQQAGESWSPPKKANNQLWNFFEQMLEF